MQAAIDNDNLLALQDERIIRFNGMTELINAGIRHHVVEIFIGLK